MPSDRHTIIYTHTISNPSNVLEGDGTASTVTLASSNSNTAFTSVIYWDQNNNGTLDPTDPVLTNLASLTGGTNGASTAAGLSVGETARIFVKVTAPPGAANGIEGPGPDALHHLAPLRPRYGRLRNGF